MGFTTSLTEDGTALAFFQANGKYWVVLSNAETAASIQVYSSPTGETWTLIADNGITCGLWPEQAPCAVFDGANTVTVFYQEGNESGTSFLQQFFLNSGTWGAPFGEQSGEPNGTFSASFIGVNSLGDFVVLYVDIASQQGSIYMQTWNGAWSGALKVSSGIESLPGFNPATCLILGPAMVLDGNNVLHVIMGLFSTNPALDHTFYYQEVEGGGLQNFQTLNFPDISGIISQPFPQMAIQGSTILWGIGRTGSSPDPFAAVLIGTPIIDPGWTESASLSDVAGPTDNPTFSFDGATLYAAWYGTTGTWYGAFSTNQFASSTSLELTNLPPGQDYGPALLFNAGDILMCTTAAVVEGPPIGVYFTDTQGGPPPPSGPPNPPFNPGGGPPSIHTTPWPGPDTEPTGGWSGKTPNWFDFCLRDDSRRYEQIKPFVPCALPLQFCDDITLLPWDEDFGRVPDKAVPFHVNGTIATPAAAAGDVLVCSAMVPQGYEGVITGIYQIFQGAGFSNGGGDIFWRIKRNQVWLKTLGNNPFAMGGPRAPMPLMGAHRLWPATLFAYYVNVPNTSGGLQTVGSLITCGMMGFYYPR